ncbi:LytR C-terminal domain-containing protein [Pseudarthrobacter sp. N5]|uniref:LytR C-terminal domain-containing protein n=1 Tax=Pseudarthrobacter sp. N5 TaxID=3418416 RepID=UPI003CFAE3A8
MTKYARDEFDRVPETASRQGVHRAVTAPPRRSLAPILVVGIAALAIGLIAFLILPKLGFLPSGSPSSVSSGAPAASPPAGSPSAGNEPSASAEPSVAATPSGTPTPSAGAVDKSQPVAVYNGAGTAGLAGRVSATVQADGWTVGPMGNWGGAPQKTSVIFYAGAAHRANAEALGALLKISTFVESTEFQQAEVVVLGPGFQ